MYIIKCSGGNDSVALIQFAKNNNLQNVYVIYCNTGWAAPFWKDRITKLKDICDSYGFSFKELKSEGMVSLVRRKGMWPSNMFQFCTEELKIKPFLNWAKDFDSKNEYTLMLGIRREESRKRSTYPEFSEQNNRRVWAPLVEYKEEKRNQLIEEAGFEGLEHRSMECFPCVNANKPDLQLLDESRISFIENVEKDLGYTKSGKPKTMFKPSKKRGATGIREVIKWANSKHGKYEAPTMGCDDGWCGS